jgi:hypothetical protein
MVIQLPKIKCGVQSKLPNEWVDRDGVWIVYQIGSLVEYAKNSNASSVEIQEYWKEHWIRRLVLFCVQEYRSGDNMGWTICLTENHAYPVFQLVSDVEAGPQCTMVSIGIY